ncbi:PEP/pyruvate-binding domain-containing protein [uncultured Flavobacterium sp.]|uniref:PEP/pyruvate-binding domain-containing protein n=1 Tax=uncultured Flavobacterium sp. TaxID=165435 RepID=UPI0025F8037F|nr:PEP/pyruvate-binding domain-containing protein [uncultured Flavobacterium sp.]
MELFIKKIDETRLGNAAEVGYKNAGLGELYNMAETEMAVPGGFAVTSTAFSYFLEQNGLYGKLGTLMDELDSDRFSNLQEIGAKARNLFANARFPASLENAIAQAYARLSAETGDAVAVRSSAYAVGCLPNNFSGQYDTYLNITGPYALMYAIKCCFASLYNDFAIKYRTHNGIAHNKVLLPVGIQQMVRSDLACSGTGCTQGLNGTGTVQLWGYWGLGRQASLAGIDTDEFVISGEGAPIQKRLGSKTNMLVYNDHAAGTNTTTDKTTPRELRAGFVLTDADAAQLARHARAMERYYRGKVEFEWAKDGLNNRLCILQAGPVMKK